MHMHIYINNKFCFIETNSPYALAYWRERRRLRERDGVRITWILVEGESK
jgi:hypothetical protein